MVNQVRGLTDDIRGKINAMVPTGVGFGCDIDGNLFVHAFDSKAMRFVRLAEGWTWDEIIEKVNARKAA